jgi:hypothetical protein
MRSEGSCQAERGVEVDIEWAVCGYECGSGNKSQRAGLTVAHAKTRMQQASYSRAPSVFVTVLRCICGQILKELATRNIRARSAAAAPADLTQQLLGKDFDDDQLLRK